MSIASMKSSMRQDDTEIVLHQSPVQQSNWQVQEKLKERIIQIVSNENSKHSQVIVSILKYQIDLDTKLDNIKRR